MFSIFIYCFSILILHFFNSKVLQIIKKFIRLKNVTYIFLTIGISYSIQAESNTKKWGREEGQLSWKNAMEKCKSNNMYLPTKKELLSLYKSPERKKWEGNWYWTSDELDSQRAWAVVLNVGDTLHIPKQYHNHVRCISIIQ